MTKVIFSFDTEDFTSPDAAEAIYREAEILREAGIKGGFCIVGLLAEQLEKWGRKDIIDALKYHDIGTHSYGHTLHPTINEYTDIEDFNEAYKEVARQEDEAVRMIERATDGQRIYCACPPGNQKSYVAMYRYADMGIPIYSDTFCDAEDGRGVFYCNIFQTKYTYSMENMFIKNSDEDLKEVLDFLASKKRVIIYTHPNMAIFSQFWDAVNYCKSNNCEFGRWKEGKRRTKEETEKFYEDIKRLINFIKNDDRFEISSYSELAKELEGEGERRITRSDIPSIREKLLKEFFPLQAPVSLSISDIFLACRDFLMGKEEHICGKVYGFLDTPKAAVEKVTLKAADIIKSAAEINAEKFLPTSVKVGEEEIGPADWLRAAMAVICGEEEVTILPDVQLPELDCLPELKDEYFMGWMQSDDYHNKYLSKRLKLQIWTMRYLNN